MVSKPAKGQNNVRTEKVYRAKLQMTKHIQKVWMKKLKTDTKLNEYNGYKKETN